MIGDLEELSYTSHRDQESKVNTLFTMLIYYGSKPICSEHLEGQRDDLPYITAKVGTVSAASRVETLMQGFTHVFNTLTLMATSPFGHRAACSYLSDRFDDIFVDGCDLIQNRGYQHYIPITFSHCLINKLN